MTKFGIGDRVRIREFREEYLHQGPGFADEMKNLCGEEFVIYPENLDMFYSYIRYKDWSWDDDWLELVEREEEFDFDIDQTEIEAILNVVVGAK
jgi:hypothetical protein